MNSSVRQVHKVWLEMSKAWMLLGPVFVLYVILWAPPLKGKNRVRWREPVWLAQSYGYLTNESYWWHWSGSVESRIIKQSARISNGGGLLLLCLLDTRATDLGTSN